MTQHRKKLLPFPLKYISKICVTFTMMWPLLLVGCICTKTTVEDGRTGSKCRAAIKKKSALMSLYLSLI